MNSEFTKNALRPVDASTMWPEPAASPTAPAASAAYPDKAATDVLGFVPSNRHERRKAAKLLKEHRKAYG